MTAIRSTVDLQDFELPDMDDAPEVDNENVNNSQVNDDNNSQLLNSHQQTSPSETKMQTKEETFHDSVPLVTEASLMGDSIDNEVSLKRWKTLTMRTLEMRHVALSCPTLLAHPLGNDVIKRLDGLIDFLENIENPCPDDFEFVDQRMQIVNELVGRLTDCFLEERREQSQEIYKRLYSIIKGIAACSVVAGFVAVVGDFVSDW